MKKIWLFVAVAGLSLTSNQSLSAQEKEAGRHFYVEFGGPGLIMSANFDSRFIPGERLGFGFRMGGGFAVRGKGGLITVEENSDGSVSNVPNVNVARTYYSFPVGVNYILGKPGDNSCFEVGAVAMLYTAKVHPYNYYGTEPASHMNVCLTFMYRVAPVDGGASFRIGFTPIIGASGNLYPTGAIGFGYLF